MDHSDADEVRVLLVEDDAALAQMYRVKLERDGYAVRVAGDGEEALGLLRGDLPDLIFLDVRLPRMDGLTFLERLRAGERTKNIPVVIVSNYSEQDLVSRGLQLGALEYLIKSQTTPGQLSHGVPDWSRPYVYPSEGAAEEIRN
jgi:two-component system, OmpR family, phosphate regulon response regulator PhoB